MLKIVKSRVYNYDRNTVEIASKLESEAAAEAAAAEAEEALTPADEEALRIAEEKRKAEEEKLRFEAAVKERADAIVNARRKAMDAEYKRLVSSGQANAERLISDAKSKTKAVFDAAEEECRKLRARAEREGFEAGFEAGHKESVKKCEQYLEAAAKFLGEINSKKEAYFISHEYEMLETVMDMVRKITMSEIRTNPAIIDTIAANAAKGFRNSDFIKITVCEGEASKEFVTDAAFVKSLITFIPEIEVEEMSREDVPSGTVIIDNGSEIIDASIPTQLEFLREIVKTSGTHSDEDEASGMEEEESGQLTF